MCLAREAGSAQESRIDGTGRDGVDPDARSGQLERGGTGDLEDGALRPAVRGPFLLTANAGDRGDADNAAGALMNHDLGRPFRGEKHRADIGFELDQEILLARLEQ